MLETGKFIAVFWKINNISRPVRRRKEVRGKE